MSNMIMNKAFIEGKIYDVIEFTEYGIEPYCGDSLALIVGDYILPVRAGNSSGANARPGVYIMGAFYNVLMPRNEQEAETYSKNHLACFVQATTFQDVVKAKEKLEADEFNHLVSSDNVFCPTIDQINDDPLMIGLKMAVQRKQCDINRYSEKFGSDFNNDRRKFNSNDITTKKYESISKNLDIRTTLIIEDMNPQVPNPMKSKIVLTWVGDGTNDSKYETLYNNRIKSKEEGE